MATRKSKKISYFVALNKLGSAELEDSRVDFLVDRRKPQEPTLTCESIDQDGPLLRLAAKIPGDDKFAVEVHIPHHFVLYILGGPDKALRRAFDKLSP